MNEVQKTFMNAIARASGRAQWYVRNLSRADREDILQMAAAWCWEHRTEYDPSVALEHWFLGAVQNAKRAFLNGEVRNTAEGAFDITTGGDPTQDTVIRLQQAETLARNLTEVERVVAKMSAEGHTRAEMQGALNGIDNNTIAAIRVKLAPLINLIPDPQHQLRVIRKIARPTDIEERDLQGIDFAPPQGKDCRPCWRCKWFEGYLPGGHLDHKMEITEPEVRKAVADTEARKIEIAHNVRGDDHGTISDDDRQGDRGHREEGSDAEHSR